MKAKPFKKHVEAPEENAVNAAAARIYEKYGTNLGAFFRDLHAELKRQEPQRKPFVVK